MNLNDVFWLLGCGKCRHGYGDVYSNALRELRRKNFRLLEIGVDKGLSLLAWTEWFPNAEIVGLDTFQRRPPESIPALQHPRVSWVKADSREPIDIGDFDVIIDDGLHTHAAQLATYKVFGHRARHYFIEDVWPFDRMTKDQKQHKWLRQDGFSDEEYRDLLAALHGRVKHHDLRKRRHPDSYLIHVQND